MFKVGAGWLESRCWSDLLSIREIGLQDVDTYKKEGKDRENELELESQWINEMNENQMNGIVIFLSPSLKKKHLPVLLPCQEERGIKLKEERG